jgi:hypothetical protein
MLADTELQISFKIRMTSTTTLTGGSWKHSRYVDSQVNGQKLFRLVITNLVYLGLTGSKRYLSTRKVWHLAKGISRLERRAREL